jgi:uncharacterized protein (DUF983 family)
MRGKLFQSLWQMHETCPACGIVYEREQGYFMNAIFFGYILSFLAMLPFNVVLYVREVAPIWFLVGNLVLLTLLSPLVFRYSRALWLHIDEVLDPHQAPIPDPENEGTP